MNKKYAIIYFSGTGNTRLIARHLAEKLAIKAHSIEEELDWAEFIKRV